MTSESSTSVQALADVRVLEVGEFISAPHAAKLLADLGAEVVKVEDPSGGDEARRVGPFPGHIPHPDKSASYLYNNTNKLGITLDLRKFTAAKIFKELIRDTDVLIENQPVRRMKELGLDYETLKAVNPNLVMVSITPFGQSGPYADYKSYALNSYHASAVGHRYLGDPKREPLIAANYFGEYFAGINAAGAAMVGIHARDVVGRGQYVDTSVAETLGVLVMGYQLVSLYFDRKHTGVRHGYYHVGGAPAASLPCKDGYVFVLAAERFMWKGIAKVMGDPEWMKAPIFDVTFGERARYGDEIYALIQPWLLEHTKEEIFKLHQGVRALTCPEYTMKDLLEHPHLRERKFIVDMEHPVAGTWKAPGAPYILSETPWRLRRPAPRLGEHNVQVLGKLGYTKQDLVDMRRLGVI